MNEDHEAIDGRVLVLQVPYVLPDLNTVIEIAKKSPFRYSTMKRSAETKIGLAISEAKRHWNAGHDSFDCPVEIRCLWELPDLRKDPDNVAHGIKYILDGLVTRKIIRGDGAKWIKAIHHEFSYGLKTPGVTVALIGCPSYTPKGATK